jgi:hypothetical protein
MAREYTLQGMLHTEEKLFLPGEMLHTDIDIKDDKLTITVKQQFWNPTPTPCGLFYFYPLPPGTSNGKVKFRVEPYQTSQGELETWRASAKELPELDKFPGELFGFAIKALQPNQKITVEFSYECSTDEDLAPIVVLPPLHGGLQMEPSEIDEMLPPVRHQRHASKDGQEINRIIFDLTKDVEVAKRTSDLLTDDELRVQTIYHADLETETHWGDITKSGVLKEDPQLLATHQRQEEDYKRMREESEASYQQIKVKAKSWRDQLQRLQQQLTEAKRQLAFLSAKENAGQAEEILSDLLQRQEKLEARLRESQPGEPITVADREREETLKSQVKHFEDLASMCGFAAMINKDKDEARHQDALQEQQKNLQIAKDYLQQYIQQKQKNAGSPAPSKTEELRKTAFDFVTRFKDVAPVK